MSNIDAAGLLVDYQKLGCGQWWARSDMESGGSVDMALDGSRVRHSPQSPGPAMMAALDAVASAMDGCCHHFVPQVRSNPQRALQCGLAWGPPGEFVAPGIGHIYLRSIYTCKGTLGWMLQSYAFY